MTYGKSMAPVVQAETDFLKAMSVDKTCNETKATQCLNNWLINGAKYYQQYNMEQCIKTKAKCTTKWDDMTNAQKVALAKKYQTSVQNMGLAWKKVNDKIMLKLATTWADHMKRRQAMAVKFVAAAKTAAKGMGCSSTCIDTAFSSDSHPNHVLGYIERNCACGTNVVKFTPGKISNYIENDFDTSEELNIF